MPVVLNRRSDEIPPDAVYVGRGSKWGNPYVVGRDGTREMVISLYKRHLEERGLLTQVEELRGKDLVCWCAPMPCHGDVLMELANA